MRRFLLSLFAAVMFLAPAASSFAAGAIAVDDEEGLAAEDVGYGIGWGNNRAAAERAALAECKKAGNTNCKVAVWFETCGAYVGSKTTFGIGWGKTEAIAKKKAFDECGKGCKLVVAECE